MCDVRATATYRVAIMEQTCYLLVRKLVRLSLLSSIAFPKPTSRNRTNNSKQSLPLAQMALFADQDASPIAENNQNESSLLKYQTINTIFKSFYCS